MSDSHNVIAFPTRPMSRKQKVRLIKERDLAALKAAPVIRSKDPTNNRLLRVLDESIEMVKRGEINSDTQGLSLIQAFAVEMAEKQREIEEAQKHNGGAK